MDTEMLRAKDLKDAYMAGGVSWERLFYIMAVRMKR